MNQSKFKKSFLTFLLGMSIVSAVLIFFCPKVMAAPAEEEEDAAEENEEQKEYRERYERASRLGSADLSGGVQGVASITLACSAPPGLSN